MTKKHIPLAIFVLLSGSFSLLNSCRSFTDIKSPLYNPDDHIPLQFGVCQAGAQWPEDNYNFRGAPGAYERELWSPYLKAQGRQELYDELGIHWIRSDFSWKRMEPHQGIWTFRSYDWLVDAAVENERKILVILSYDAPWIYEKKGTSRNITEKELHHFLNYVRTIARRHGDRVGAFEIWNEPNFPRFWEGSDEDFFALTKATIQVLKEEAPEVPIVVGALSYHPLMFGKSYLKKMMEAGALEGADVVSLHPYAMSLEAAARRVADAKALLESNGYKQRIWISEMGFSTTGLYPHKVSLENHYSQTVKALTLMTAAGADIITWYKIFDSYNPEDEGLFVPSERSFGLMSRKREWKPGASAYALIATELRGLKYSPTRLELKGFHKSQLRAFLYDDEDGKTVIVLWPKNPEKTLSIFVNGMEEFQVYTEDSVYEGGPGTKLISEGTPLVLKGISREEISLSVGLLSKEK